MHHYEHVEPILRWAGGKRWLVPSIRTLLADTSINNYHEPFLGGAAVFLGMPQSGKSFLADANSELIEVYQCVRDSHVEVANALEKHMNTEEHYYETRCSVPGTAVERAARFIFLNHTSYNGIYRVNLAGKYNVPFGFRKKPNFPTVDSLEALSDRLKNSLLRSQDFEVCMADVQPGDLVFLDPPYTVSHNNNGFVKYNQKLFSWEDQCRLSVVIDKIKAVGAYYILCNAAHSSIAELFEKGDRLVVTRRKNAIGGASSERGYASEYLFTNVRQR